MHKESNFVNATKPNAHIEQNCENNNKFDIKQKKTAFFNAKYGIILFGVETRLLRGKK